MTITVLSNGLVSYASLAEANAFLDVDIVRRMAWDGVMEDADRERYLVAATNRIDLLRFRGEKAGGAAQANAFPRSGLEYADGTPVPANEVPAVIARATSLLAGSIVMDSETAEARRTASLVRKVKAGPVEVENYRDNQVDNRPIQDSTVFELVREFLAGQASQSLPYASNNTDIFTTSDRYARATGFG